MAPNEGAKPPGSPSDPAFDKIARMLALHFMREMQLGDQIAFLSKVGFDRNEIAALVDSSAEIVSVRISQHKAKRKKKRKTSSKRS